MGAWTHLSLIKELSSVTKLGQLLTSQVASYVAMGAGSQLSLIKELSSVTKLGQLLTSLVASPVAMGAGTVISAQGTKFCNQVTE